MIYVSCQHQHPAIDNEIRDGEKKLDSDLA